MQSRTTTTSGPEVYLKFEPLAPACQPAWVTRHDGATLLTIDPSTTKFQALTWVVDHLTPAEQDAYRAAYGGPPRGEHGPDDWTADEPVDVEVPPSLVLHPAVPQIADVRCSREYRSRTQFRRFA